MPRGTCSAGHPEGSALESGEWLMSTFRCAANGAARSWISPIQVPEGLEGLDARSVLDLPGMRPPLLDDLSPPENGLYHPPAQWKEGTLPSRRHLRPALFVKEPIRSRVRCDRIAHGPSGAAAIRCRPTPSGRSRGWCGGRECEASSALERARGATVTRERR